MSNSSSSENGNTLYSYFKITHIGKTNTQHLASITNASDETASDFSVLGSDNPTSTSSIVQSRDKNSIPKDLGTDSPNKPIYDFPKTKGRAFNASWYLQFEWLEYSKENDSAFCFCCRIYLPPNENDAEDTFVITGFRNWKKAMEDDKGLKKHDACKSHQKAYKIWLTRQARDLQSCSVHQLLGSAQLENRRYYIKSIAEIFQFIIVNELPFRGHYDVEADTNGLFENLFKFTMSKDTKLKDISLSLPENARYTSVEIQNEIIEILGKMVQRKISEIISSSVAYSLLADSTRDRANDENLCIGARFIDDSGNVRELCFALNKLKSANAESISNSIYDTLLMCEIPLHKLITFSFDGANVMAGANAGVQRLLSDRLDRNVPFIHCFNHQLHLAVVEIVTNTTIASRTFDYAEQLYVFFRRLSASTRYEGTHLPRLIPQRWTGHIGIVEAVHKNISEISNVLFELAGSRYPEASEAEGLLNRIATLEFCFSILAFERILQFLIPLNNFFQKEGADMTTALRLLEATCSTVQTQCTAANAAELLREANRLLREKILNEPDELQSTATPPKRLRRVPVKFTDENIYYYDAQATSENYSALPVPKRLCDFYLKLSESVVHELKTRFTERSMSIIKAAYNLLKIETRNSESCITLLSLLPESQNFGSIGSELDVLKNLLKPEYSSFSSLIEDFSKYSNAFKLFNTVISIARTLPISTSTVESCFSVLTQILRPQRVSMGYDRKSYLVLMAFNKNITSLLDLDEFVKIFSAKSRRLQFL